MPAISQPDLGADHALAGLGPTYGGHEGCGGSGASRDLEVSGPLEGRWGHTQAQSCSSPSGWRSSRSPSLEPGWRPGPRVQMGDGSSGRRRRAKRARAAEANTSSRGSERKPSTMSVAEPRRFLPQMPSPRSPGLKGPTSSCPPPGIRQEAKLQPRGESWALRARAAGPPRGRSRAGTQVDRAGLRGGPGNRGRGARCPAGLGALAAGCVEGSLRPRNPAAAAGGQRGGEVSPWSAGRGAGIGPGCRGFPRGSLR
uniref:Ankyrin repeat domain 65 n=1 Tax=Myotis myotis TaxID=51298 RepID=A0A7J7QWA7_MYOMY|nr:ankyrin repeat domain 65 [Myotis myotis]